MVRRSDGCLDGWSEMSRFLYENHRGGPSLTLLNMLGVLGVLHVLHVLNMSVDALLAC